jgi:tRNA (guanine37-N1)-methyltransferase
VEFHIVTIFPRMVDALVSEGILARSIERGLLRVVVHDLRDHTTDRHRVVDDTPFGGGPGMVMKPEPVVRAVEDIAERFGAPAKVILPSPQGRRFMHEDAVRLSRLDRVVVLCGRYEGIDERVRTLVEAEELSIGDYVLSGGEPAALVMLDAMARLLPGAVGDDQSVDQDSFVRGVLDYPHYTRPAEFRGLAVPGVLLSGHHAEIERWRRREALRRTMERRPDLLAGAQLDQADQDLLRELARESTGHE